MATDDKNKKKTEGKVSKTASSKGGSGQKKKSSSAAEEKAPAINHGFSERYMPLIWGALGLLLAICFVLNFFCKAETPKEHWMGFFGFYLCKALFGLFGWAAHLLVPVFFLLAFAWRRYYRDHLVALQVSLSMLFILLVSAFIHVCACQGNAELVNIADPIELFNTGAVWKSGGMIGGLLGWVMYRALRLAGSIILMVIVLPLIVMFLIGITPVDMFSRMWDKFKEKQAINKEHRDEIKAIQEEEKAAVAEEQHQAALLAARAKAREEAEARVAEEERRAQERLEATQRRAQERREAAERREQERQEAAERRTQERQAAVERAAQKQEKRTAAAAAAATTTAAATKAAAAASSDRDEAISADGYDELENLDDVSTVRIDTRTGEVIQEEPRRGGGLRRKFTAATEETAEEDGEMYPEEDDIQDVPEESTSTAYTSQRQVYGAASDTAFDRTANGVSHMEIDLDEEDVPDDIDEEEDPLADLPTFDSVNPRNGKAYSEEDMEDRDEGTVVHVLPADRSALTGTRDNPVDGLPEETAELPPDAVKPGEAPRADAAAAPTATYMFPPLELLTRGSDQYETDEDEIAENTLTLRDTLESFHIRVRDISCSCGPTVTRYEVKPDVGVRVRSIANLVDDIALSLAKSGVRIEAPIPGKSAVGIEVPNDHPSTVFLRNLLEAPEFQNHKSRIASCLGAEVSGRPVIFDINKMPHLLVSGTTGSGKSVCINCIILSILYKARPEDVKLILIDPKKVEFSVYRDIPHLYCPIVTDPKKAAGALYSAVAEMERRFELIEEVGVRNLAGYNEATAGDPERPSMPQMVIIIDELADLMMTAPADVEAAICRLAQKARAAGIHLILGTQRPSVDVITGLIKANIPSRIAFTVKSQVDSRTIIDVTGAEKLIGRGDMLYAPVGSTKPLRVQGAFVSDNEVEAVVTYVKEHNEKPVFDESFTQQMELEAAKCGNGKKKNDEGNIEDFDALGGDGDGEDAKFWEAVEVAVEANKVSTSLLQRRAGIGYGRAAKIIDRMEEMGLVTPADGNKPRKLLITPQEFAELKMNGFKR